MKNTMYLLVRWNSRQNVEESDTELFTTKQEAIQELKNSHKQVIKNMMIIGRTIEDNDLYEESYVVGTDSITFYGRIREISVERK